MRIVLDNTDRATHYKPVELPTPGAGNKRKYTVSPTSSAARRSSTSSHSSAGSQHQQQQQVQQEQEQQQQQQHGTTVSPSRASSPPPPAPYSSPAVAPKSLTNTFVGHARVAATAAVHGGQSIVAHHSSAPCPDPASPASPTSPTSPIGNPVPNNSCVSNHSPFSSSSPTGPSSHASNASSRGGGEGSSKPPVLLPQSDKFVAVQDLHISGPVHKVVRLSTKLRPRNSVDVR